VKLWTRAAAFSLILVGATSLALAGPCQEDCGKPAAPPSVYAHIGPADMAPQVAKALPRIYVPNGLDGTVTVIDSQSLKVLDTFKVGLLPQHVVPSWDLRTLWVTNNASRTRRGTLTPIDPMTGQPGPPVPVRDPYNMYFLPDGSAAIIVDEALKRLDLRDPKTMALIAEIPTPTCHGINHADFSADGRFAVFSCEFGGGALIKVDLGTRAVTATLQLPNKGMPQDVRLSPDGRTFYVADMMNDGVYMVDASSFAFAGFIATGVGAHGFVVSRDGTKLYVANRGSHSMRNGRPHGPGSVSVIDFSSKTVITQWGIPHGGSPDMGNVTADGRTLVLSGRFDREVYAIDTTSGAVQRIAVGRGPHGLTVWPQPGRYSLGHTGNMR
jgi:YVTN family beta-propeller protein